ncbi:MAG TPA: hypothetical protein VHN19_15320 [Burkholderiales bacterium]|jgi:hypothetical protein|nr:hypothetical protein [Burkholderiales bacterium]HEX2651298.1 hypothetical protein [Burkholderiales bacterium]
MMLAGRRKWISCALGGLLLSIVATQVLSGSNFARVPLGNGASIEVPKNWVVLSGNQRTTIDTFVEAKGFRLSESTLTFAANLYDDGGKTMALINSRFYPDNTLTQAEARQVSPTDLTEIDVALRKAAEIPLKPLGVRMLNWYGSKMQIINGLHVLIHEHQHSGVGGAGITRVRGLRVWRSPRSFTVTLSYRERDAAMLLPIIDYMTRSLRQE